MQLDYTFDRLGDSKLAQVYTLLVPAQMRPVASGAALRNARAYGMEGPHADGGDITSVPHFQDHASDNWEPEGAGSDGVVNRSWSGRRSNMLSWSTCSIW